MDKRVDIIIPTYKPDAKFVKILYRLGEQTLKPHKIIIMNTDKDEWDKREMEAKLIESGVSDICEIHHLTKSSFNHGATRREAVSLSESEYFVCMTQDALPRNDRLIENLLSSMSDEVKLSYARQLPYQDSDPIERCTRLFNYPVESSVKSIDDVDRLGIKAYFCPNVCAAYDRATYDLVGGFPEDVILNEDMIYASKVIQAGKSIAYEAEAQVYHAHEYSGMEQFRRNFDIAVSQTDYPEVFGGFKSESEGKKLVKMTAKYLIKHGKAYLIPKLIYISGCKYMGYKAGKSYKSLPEWCVKRMSMNQTYWENNHV